MNRALLRRLAICCTAALLVAGPMTTASAQQHIMKSIASSGCVTASGGTHQILGTIGQSAIGTAKNTAHAGFFGFWYDSGNSTVDVKTVQYISAVEFELRGVYPQPAQNQITCLVGLPKRGSVHLSVYGLLGRLLHRGAVRFREAGTHTLRLSLPQLPPGIYLLNAHWKGQTRTQRLTMLR